MARAAIEDLVSNFKLYLDKRDRKAGHFHNDVEKNTPTAERIAQVFYASTDRDGYLYSEGLVNEKTGNTGIRLGDLIGTGGHNYVFKGHIENYDALNLYNIYVNVMKHKIRERNGAGGIDKLRQEYTQEAQEMADLLKRRGLYELIRAEVLPILVSRFEDRTCAVRISIKRQKKPDEDEEEEDLTNLDEARSIAYDGLVHPNWVFAAARDKTRKDRSIQLVEYAKDIKDPGRIHLDLSLQEIAEITRQSASALCKMESLGGAHRDVKPDNIFVEKTPRSLRSRLADFDLTRIVQRDYGPSSTMTMEEDKIMGTPVYMSPEHINNTLNLTVAADICSLGLTAYYWWTGQQAIFEDPHAGDEHADSDLRAKAKFLQLLVEVVERRNPPVMPTLVRGRASAGQTKFYEFGKRRANNKFDYDFERIVAGMIAPTLDRRYTDPNELVSELDALLNGGKVSGKVESTQVFGTKRSDIPI